MQAYDVDLRVDMRDFGAKFKQIKVSITAINVSIVSTAMVSRALLGMRNEMLARLLDPKVDYLALGAPPSEWYKDR
jgi:hypothetical protein